jgi:3-deoxy-7-phosphoheptulonate synthase
MIIQLRPHTDPARVQAMAELLDAIIVRQNGHSLLLTTSKLKTLAPEIREEAEAVFVMETDIQLASAQYQRKKREVKIGDLVIGGETNHTLMITGPCAVETESQIDSVASFAHSMGVKVLRAGSYKPRTSPYSFQGLGLEGLQLLAKMRDKYGLKIITEVKDATHVDAVIEYADIIQVGAKAMYDQGTLRACGRARKPVLIKRGFGSTLQEFVQAAEFVLSGGNEEVMLCERGIRTFETKTRFTLDLCGVAYLKEHTNLPVILDPSHAMGYRYGVSDLARACTAMGVDGLLIETHPDPDRAWSDASQQLNFEEFKALYESLHSVAAAVGRKIV